MADFTLQLGKIEKDIGVFTFPYKFYVNDPVIKGDFEEMFINKFYYSEIGQATIGMFKRHLKDVLDRKMRYYEQMYMSEILAEDIDFLLNKDLKETFERDVITEDTGLSQGTSSESLNTSAASESNAVSKAMDTPQNRVDDMDNYLSSAQKTESGDKSFNETSSSSATGSTTENTGTQKEKTTLISRGNIGVTSSAELLEKYRGTFLNINEMIFAEEEIQDLFMKVYAL